MSDIQIGSVPFTESIDHFREKLNISTRFYDDLRGDIHAKAFTVAGATKIDLLKDIRRGINDAITNGSTITDFRKVFDKAVQDHGWTYKGKRGWRTRVIFDNNLRTAHMAGRWAQIERTKETRPYLEYLTVGDSRVRPEHASWHNTVLLIDDPWWNTHYPPNGYGCRCTVRTLNDRQLNRENKQVSKAPLIQEEERINTRTGEIYGLVPKGIDRGWNFNVGKAWLAPEAAFGEKIAQLPKPLRDTAISQIHTITNRIRRPFKRWAEQILADTHGRGKMVAVGYLNLSVINALERLGVKPETVAITITDARLRRMTRDLKKRIGKDLSTDDLLKLPEHILSPQAVLFQKRNPALLYVFDVGEDVRLGRFVMRVNFRERGELTNSIRSGDITPAINLKDKSQFELLQGILE